MSFPRVVSSDEKQINLYSGISKEKYIKLRMRNKNCHIQKKTRVIVKRLSRKIINYQN